MTSPARLDGAFVPEQIVLLSADPTDAVTRALRLRGAEFGCPVVEITAERLLREVELGEHWRVGDHRIDPARAALINRLPMADRLVATAPTPADTGAGTRPTAGATESAPGRQAIWTRLRHEIARFGYASSLPTPTSLIGCFGSLADLWADLPRRVPGVRVPEHSTAASPRPLTGANIHTVNRWALYQLGRPRAEALAADDLPDALRLDYRRPPGRLAVLAQVGGTLMFANPPPETTRVQADAMVAFARALAARSPERILEHVFFISGDAPVLYSSCPVPALSGTHRDYPQLVIQGVRDDIAKRGRVAAR